MTKKLGCLPFEKECRLSSIHKIIETEQKPLEKILPKEFICWIFKQDQVMSYRAKQWYTERKYSGHLSQESHKMNNEKIVQKISRGKSDAWETNYVESNIAKDMVEEKV